MSNKNDDASVGKSSGAGLSQSIHPIFRRAQRGWESVAPRSRTVLSVCAAALFIGLVYAYAWLPASRSRAINAERIPILEAKLATMRAETEEIKRLLAVPPNTAPNTADKTGGRSAADLSGLQAIFGASAKIAIDNNRAFVVTIPSISYVAFLDRIDQALLRYRLKVASLSITALNDAISTSAGNTKPAEAALVTVEVVLSADAEVTSSAQSAQ